MSSLTHLLFDPGRRVGPSRGWTGLWIVAGLLAVAPAVRAVETGRPSRTAIMAAAFRAIGARNPDAEFRNPDYLAGKFLRSQDLALLAASGADYRVPLKLDGAPLVDYLHESIAVRTNFVRTRHIDATLEASLDAGARQIVVLGAGLDSRGYRFRDRLRQALFLEVDLPATQALKKERVRALLGRAATAVRFVPMDFTRDDLLTQLTKSGYDERATTLFIWEGVVHYLPEPAVRATLRFVAQHSGAGSRIVFDYPFDTNRRINNPTNVFSKWGEPFLFGFPKAGPADVLREEGLQLVSDAPNAALVSRYAVRPDGSSSLRPPDPTDSVDVDDAAIAVAEVPRRRE